MSQNVSDTPDAPVTPPTHDTEPDPSLSHCSVALLSGSPVTLWAPVQTEVGTGTTTDTVLVTELESVPELALGLAPGKLVVVGRAKPHHEVPYLDPAYRSTTMMPDGHQSVLYGNDPKDICVSRAHFTLRGAPEGGVVFTNGVPAVGGGVRPPTNGTWVVAPGERFLDPGEEVTIGCGEVVVICLPNGCRLQLRAR